MHYRKLICAIAVAALAMPIVRAEIRAHIVSRNSVCGT
jgi:hypothetical protein